MSVKTIGIGTKFRTRGKRKDLCTVIDILKTYNSAFECVEVKYLCEHDFLGQKIKHTELSTTILMGMGDF